jgi:hypothetical protein
MILTLSLAFISLLFRFYMLDNNNINNNDDMDKHHFISVDLGATSKIRTQDGN